MKASSSPILLGGCVLIWALAGCANSRTALREPGAHFAVKSPDSLDHVSERERYVDTNYQSQLNNGRATNEKEARAMASLEWERVRHRSDYQTESKTTWSSRDAERRKQEKLSSDLEKMEQE